jgi:hypothetical protein
MVREMVQNSNRNKFENLNTYCISPIRCPLSGLKIALTVQGSAQYTFHDSFS